MAADFRKKLKTIFSLVIRIAVFPLYILYLLCTVCCGKDDVFHSFSQLLSLVPGKLGNYIRKEFYRMSLRYCDSECAICFGTIISHPDTEIGKGVYIGPNCNLGTVKLEDHVTLGSGVHIPSGKHQHNFSDISVPVQEQGGHYEKITVGEDTWIGNGSIIMDHVGRKCIIGAGSVVVKAIDDYSVAAGNPTRVIRKRT